MILEGRIEDADNVEVTLDKQSSTLALNGVPTGLIGKKAGMNWFSVREFIRGSREDSTRRDGALCLASVTPA